LDDLIVGAYGANPNGIDSGKAYIILYSVTKYSIKAIMTNPNIFYTIDC
jgi:hypothetical protein